MARKTDPTDRIVDATLALIAEQGWRAAQPEAIAARAGADLATVYRVTGGRLGVLEALIRRVDLAMLEGAQPDPQETSHDRLFDALMRRFDALAPYKPAILVLARDWRTRPLVALANAPAVLRSMRWALAAAGIPTDGIRGAMLVQGLALAYAAAMRVWLDDDSPDLGRTMAALDRSLRRLERLTPMLRTRSSDGRAPREDGDEASA